jgi:ubiquinone/menaquinone biosynthesis C-methylase UbiE
LNGIAKPEYALGSDDAEIARLQTQAEMLAEPTAVLFQRGGIRPGMRVLDLGSGPGDVAFLVAEMVGPDGVVVGVEQDPAQIAEATRRRDTLGLTNVEFRQGDARSYVDDKPFDAAVCRLLLMHLPDAVDVLAHQMSNLRPGGAFVAVDYDIGGVRALPEVQLFVQVGEWISAAFAHAQVDPRVGMRFPLYFEQAGYSDIGSLGLQSYSSPRDGSAARYVVEVARAMAHAIVASGVATEEEMGLDTLADRLAAAIDQANAVYTVPTVVGGWGRRP